jgi:SAM-dependent methyltransferase
MNSGAEAAAAPTEGVVRLNLGCGDKPLPGYINVDVASSRGGRAPDVIADIRHMEPFGPGYADEIMAIHVIEHIDRWEVVEVLRRWLAVLKPGGRLVLETPNLISACKALLADPLKAARAGKTGQMSMWPLYGDPSWRDPLMMHKWLYTPQSLGEAMHEAGFVSIKQAPAQFKLKEPRDMRLVGSKQGT